MWQKIKILLLLEIVPIAVGLYSYFYMDSYMGLLGFHATGSMSNLGLPWLFLGPFLWGTVTVVIFTGWLLYNILKKNTPTFPPPLQPSVTLSAEARSDIKAFTWTKQALVILPFLLAFCYSLSALFLLLDERPFDLLNKFITSLVFGGLVVLLALVMFFLTVYYDKYKQESTRKQVYWGLGLSLVYLLLGIVILFAALPA